MRKLDRLMMMMMMMASRRRRARVPKGKWTLMGNRPMAATCRNVTFHFC